jgi:hypothetical protein
LVNKSNKLKNSIEEAEFSLNNKFKELEGLNSLLTAYKENSDLGDQDEVREVSIILNANLIYSLCIIRILLKTGEKLFLSKTI